MATVRHLGLFQLGCPTETSLINEVYPEIWMPEQYAMAFYWRVKKWRLDYSASWREAEDGSGITFSFSGSKEFFFGQIIWEEYFDPDLSATYGQPLAHEKELVCPKFVNPLDLFLSNGLFGARINALAQSGGAGTTFFISTQLDRSPFVRVTNNVKQYRVGIRFTTRTLRWNPIRAASFSGAGQHGTFTYDLLGQAFDCPIYATNTRNSNFLNMVTSLTAIEYWPYDPGDGGGPIYDSTTGQQLRDFPG